MPSAAAEAAISVVKANLHDVFEEPDPMKRRAAIERLWVPSSEAVFIDPDRIWRGHDEIDACVAGLTKKFEGWVFGEIGDAQVLPDNDDGEGLCVVRLAWGYGPPGEEFKVKGQDVATMQGGRMKMLYAILAPQDGQICQ